MHVSFTGAGRDALDLAISRAPAHLRPAYQAARDGTAGFVFVAQGWDRFEVPSGLPQILLIGDDLNAALGPAAFHARSVRRYLATCRAAVIVAAEPIPSLYWDAYARAVERRENVVIVETRPEREAEWLDLIRAAAPADVALSLGTVAPAGRA